MKGQTIRMKVKIRKKEGGAGEQVLAEQFTRCVVRDENDP